MVQWKAYSGWEHNKTHEARLNPTPQKMIGKLFKSISSSLSASQLG